MVPFPVGRKFNVVRSSHLSRGARCSFPVVGPRIGTPSKSINGGVLQAVAVEGLEDRAVGRSNDRDRPREGRWSASGLVEAGDCVLPPTPAVWRTAPAHQAQRAWWPPVSDDDHHRGRPRACVEADADARRGGLFHGMGGAGRDDRDAAGGGGASVSPSRPRPPSKAARRAKPAEISSRRSSAAPAASLKSGAGRATREDPVPWCKDPGQRREHRAGVSTPVHVQRKRASLPSRADTEAQRSSRRRHDVGPIGWENTGWSTTVVRTPRDGRVLGVEELDQGRPTAAALHGRVHGAREKHGHLQSEFVAAAVGSSVGTTSRRDLRGRGWGRRDGRPVRGHLAERSTDAEASLRGPSRSSPPPPPQKAGRGPGEARRHPCGASVAEACTRSRARERGARLRTAVSRARRSGSMSRS